MSGIGEEREGGKVKEKKRKEKEKGRKGRKGRGRGKGGEGKGGREEKEGRVRVRGREGGRRGRENGVTSQPQWYSPPMQSGKRLGHSTTPLLFKPISRDLPQYW